MPVRLRLHAQRLRHEPDLHQRLHLPLHLRVEALAQQQAKIEEITLLAANLLRSRVEGRTSSTFWWNVGAVALGLGAAFAWLAISKRKAV